MELPQRFCVRWNSYKSNLQTAFPKLLTSEHFVDVTLACEKQYLKCHKVVLSACSVYFEDLLVNNPCPHPIVFMKDVAFWEMKALVEFMYKGEVSVSQEQLDSLLKSAESLQIRGLSGAKRWMDEPGPEPVKKKKGGDEDESSKSIQITPTCEDIDADDVDLIEHHSDTNEKTMELKDEAQDLDDSAYMDNTDTEESPSYRSDDGYHDNTEPGPSGIGEFISLEELGVGPPILPFKSKLPSLAERKAVRAPSRRSSYKQYTMTSMWTALSRIEHGLSVYRASIEYGVPRKTLRNWMKKYNIMSHFDIRKQTRHKTDDADDSGDDSPFKI